MVKLIRPRVRFISTISFLFKNQPKVTVKLLFPKAVLIVRWRRHVVGQFTPIDRALGHFYRESRFLLHHQRLNPEYITRSFDCFLMNLP